MSRRPSRARWASLPLAATAVLSAACSGSAEVGASDRALRVTTVARGLNYPWGLVFLPDGSMLVTEKPGRLRHVTPAGELSAPIEGVPAVSYGGQGGLFDVALDPDFAANRRIYLSYAEAAGGVKGTTVARAVLSADRRRLGNLVVIFRQRPKVGGNGHFGGRLAFAADGRLFVTLGERQLDGDRQGDTREAQGLGSHLGKIVRIEADGKVPPDNPFVGNDAALPEIWSYGHRNPQGAAIHPVTGVLWAVEHGPQGGDELNVVVRGGNYGWPAISHGCNYGSLSTDCTPVGGAREAPGMMQPITTWVPRSTAPSGLAFYDHDRIAQWRGDVFVGALAGRGLWHLELDGDRVVSREKLLDELGERIRDVRQGPDGLLYLLTDAADGRILQISR